MINISVLVSGRGSNLQAIIDGIDSGQIEDAQIKLVISSNEHAYALERAHDAGINTAVVSSADFPGVEEKGDELLRLLEEAGTDLVVLAGYMSILSLRVCRAYKGRMINIHPSLIPKHCGEGMYGIKVHESVIASGDAESGATVHYVDDKEVDGGEIILQNTVPVMPNDTPETLAARVLETEHKLYVQGVNIAKNNIEKD